MRVRARVHARGGRPTQVPHSRPALPVRALRAGAALGPCRPTTEQPSGGGGPPHKIRWTLERPAIYKFSMHAMFHIFCPGVYKAVRISSYTRVCVPGAAPDAVPDDPAAHGPHVQPPARLAQRLDPAHGVRRHGHALVGECCGSAGSLGLI